jgi:hypothetical protein
MLHISTRELALLNIIKAQHSLTRKMRRALYSYSLRVHVDTRTTPSRRLYCAWLMQKVVSTQHIVTVAARKVLTLRCHHLA